MKQKYNGLYDFFCENRGRMLSEFTLKEIGEASGIDHPQAVKNGIDYLVKNMYVSFGYMARIEVHDGTLNEEYMHNASSLIFDYMKMKKIFNSINTLTQPYYDN